MSEEYLKKRSKELMLDRMPRNENIMVEIFDFDVNNLESTSSLKISQFIIGLSQFIIYFGSQVNKTKVELMQKKDIIDSYIARSDIKARTKGDKYRKVIDENPELKQIELGVKTKEQELTLMENKEKYFIELINAFKRELTRRDQELKSIREERRL